MNQTKNSFDKASLVKMGKGALISGGAVVLLYILQWLTTIDFGPYTAVAVGILSIVINNVKEWRKGDLSLTK